MEAAVICSVPDYSEPLIQFRLSSWELHCTVTVQKETLCTREQCLRPFYDKRLFISRVYIQTLFNTRDAQRYIVANAKTASDGSFERRNMTKGVSEKTFPILSSDLRIFPWTTHKIPAKKGLSNNRLFGRSLVIQFTAFVPAVSLSPYHLCVSLWQVVQQRDVMDYGLVEEFVTTVLERVPDMMSYRERVQLIMGLRAQLVLELCRSDHLANPETIQPHLNRMKTCIITHRGKEISDPEVEASESNFLKLIQTLLEDPVEKEYFFQVSFVTKELLMILDFI
ncbi:unnamed protein product [Oncorhynchus mykiss]|uniref:TERF1-interacting nuclear factor 2 N-terminal domain-containing protein n=1 Tax=Oncorhynchus mykiss TaxID=8022 RepID=A0A060Y6P0_ONCMY|nr:unnamed protein product [Oncorhynchus mykiss]